MCITCTIGLPTGVGLGATSETLEVVTASIAAIFSDSFLSLRSAFESSHLESPPPATGNVFFLEHASSSTVRKLGEGVRGCGGCKGVRRV